MYLFDKYFKTEDTELVIYFLMILQEKRQNISKEVIKWSLTKYLEFFVQSVLRSVIPKK